MEVFRHQTFVKDKKLIEINQLTISSCSVYLSGEYYTMDQALDSFIAVSLNSKHTQDFHQVHLLCVKRCKISPATVKWTFCATLISVPYTENVFA